MSQKPRPKRTPLRAAVVAAPTPAGAAASRLIGYARVSTADQTTRPQLDALRAAGCAEVFEDVLSGSVDDRDGLQTCLDALRAGDTLVVPRLDRLGRSMPHLVSTVHALAARGVGFRSLAESIDTTSATGRLVLHLFAALADFERGLIVERTKASLTAKRQRGEPLGRPRALTPAQVREARGMIERGKTIAYAARALRCGRATLYRGFAAEAVAAEKTLAASSSPAQTAAGPVAAAKTAALHSRRTAKPPARKIFKGTIPKPIKSGSRLRKADRGALYALDHILEQERQIELRYALPFRAPHKTMTSLQQCGHCGKDIAFLVFGDSAKDIAGLEAYARMMAEPIQRTNLPAWIITPPADPSSLENPSLLLKVHPVREEPCWIVPDEWLQLIADLSNAHCKGKTARIKGKVPVRAV